MRLRALAKPRLRLDTLCSEMRMFVHVWRRVASAVGSAENNHDFSQATTRSPRSAAFVGNAPRSVARNSRVQVASALKHVLDRPWRRSCPPRQLAAARACRSIRAFRTEAGLRRVEPRNALRGLLPLIDRSWQKRVRCGAPPHSDRRRRGISFFPRPLRRAFSRDRPGRSRHGRARGAPRPPASRIGPGLRSAR